MEKIIWHFAEGFEIVGSIMVIWGGLHGVYFLIKSLATSKGQDLKYNKVLSILGYKMVLALDFFLAGDILGTVAAPNWTSLGQLGTLVVIRTIMSYFILKEIRSQEDVDGKPVLSKKTA